ncbi:uncharacterized protein RHO25_003698 [Cercospora beticola]|uniref:Uncharacterized protein n=1 Tax=Cercospora beticola TaxID=122368 RepID=A0ABZ0NHQ8_CERBT|nr:hypothetical protein RHO25_003698 [Cercospora beticola]
MFDAFEAAAARDVLRVMLAQAAASRPADCSGCKSGAGLTQMDFFWLLQEQTLRPMSCFKLHFVRTAALEAVAKAALRLDWVCDLLANAPPEDRFVILRVWQASLVGLLSSEYAQCSSATTNGQTVIGHPTPTRTSYSVTADKAPMEPNALKYATPSIWSRVSPNDALASISQPCSPMAPILHHN